MWLAVNQFHAIVYIGCTPIVLEPDVKHLLIVHRLTKCTVLLSLYFVSSLRHQCGHLSERFYSSNRDR